MAPESPVPGLALKQKKKHPIVCRHLTSQESTLAHRQHKGCQQTRVRTHGHRTARVQIKHAQNHANYHRTSRELESNLNLTLQLNFPVEVEDRWDLTDRVFREIVVV